MAIVLCSEAQPGMVLSADVKDRQGQVLITRGATLTEAHLRALKIRGVNAIHVVDPTEEASKKTVLSPEDMSQARQQVEALFRLNAAHRGHPFIKTLHSQYLLRVTRHESGKSLAQPPETLAMNQFSRLAPDTEEADLDEPSLDHLVMRTQTVASMPSIYHQLLEIVNDERSSAKDIARVISVDTGLTARLLRLVNSPFYGFPGKIETVSRAVAIVGVNELCQLAMATTVINTFNRALAGKMDIKGFWKHSLACAALCRALALRRREPNPELHFVIGLLHDIGRLVLFTHMPQKTAAVWMKELRGNEAAYRHEAAEWAFDHCDVGQALLNAWGLPDSLSEPVGNHHHPARNPSYPMETAVVHTANIIANVLYAAPVENPREACPTAPPFTPSAWDMLALSPDIVPQIMQEAALQVKELSSVFELETGS